ncbi:8306_t:CDS:2, partial [Scutellospora calospora]
MNNRYFYNRAYYLAVLSAALQDKNSTLNVKVEFGALDGDRRRSIILLKEFFIPNFIIRILPYIPMDVFSPQRFSPSRNNIRKTNNVIIKGTTNSTTLESLREAFETLELTTVMPTETPILKKAFFSIRFNSLFDKKGKASIEIFNPLNTVIRFLMIDANVTVKDELIRIINQKFAIKSLVDTVNGDLKVNVTSDTLISVGNDYSRFMVDVDY